MEEKQLFIDILTPLLISKAEEQIKSNLLSNFYEDLMNDPDLEGDRKWADMSDMKEIRIAFNQFYNLSPEDAEYLD